MADIEQLLAELGRAGRIIGVETSNGPGIMIRGSAAELQELRQQLERSSISTSMEGSRTDFGQSYGDGLRIRSESVAPFRQQFLGGWMPPQALTVKGMVEEHTRSGRVIGVETGNGPGIMIQGSAQELQELQRRLEGRGISTSMEGPGTDFGRSYGDGLRIRSTSVEPFRRQFLGGRMPQQAATVEGMVEEHTRSGRVIGVETGNGPGIMIQGSAQELQELQRRLEGRGISTSMEGPGTDFGRSYGDGLRIRTESVAPFRDQFLGRQMPPQAARRHASGQTPTAEETIAHLEQSGRIREIPTSKVPGIMIEGTSDELGALQRQLEQRGIKTQMHGPDSPIGEGLRIRSESIEQFQQQFPSARAARGADREWQESPDLRRSAKATYETPDGPKIEKVWVQGTGDQRAYAIEFDRQLNPEQMAHTLGVKTNQLGTIDTRYGKTTVTLEHANLMEGIAVVRARRSAPQQAPYEGRAQQPAEGIATYDTNGLNGGRYEGLQQDHVVGGRVEGIQTADEARAALERGFSTAARVTRSEQTAGSTGSVAIATPDGKLTVAQLGDSPIVVQVVNQRTGETQTIDLTKDHSPNSPTERARIESEGGFVYNQRVGGTLAVSRSFGDKDVTGVSAIPEISTYDLKPHLTNPDNVVYVIIGSDGLTEHRTPERLARNITPGKSVGEIAHGMVDDAVRSTAATGRTTSDNISVSVAEIKPGNTTTAMVGVFDGHGTGSEYISARAMETVSTSVHKYGAIIVKEQKATEEANRQGAATERDGRQQQQPHQQQQFRDMRGESARALQDQQREAQRLAQEARRAAMGLDPISAPTPPPPASAATPPTPPPVDTPHATPPAPPAASAAEITAAERAAASAGDLHVGKAVVGVRGGVVGAGISGVVTAGVALFHGADTIAAGGSFLEGVAEGAIPGSTTGFEGIRKGTWLDRTLSTADTFTGSVMTGALLTAGGAAVASGTVVAAPVAAPVAAGSLLVAGVAGAANLTVQLARDAAFVTGLSEQGGVLTGIHDGSVAVAHRLARSGVITEADRPKIDAIKTDQENLALINSPQADKAAAMLDDPSKLSPELKARSERIAAAEQAIKHASTIIEPGQDFTAQQKARMDYNTELAGFIHAVNGDAPAPKPAPAVSESESLIVMPLTLPDSMTLPPAAAAAAQAAGQKVTSKLPETTGQLAANNMSKPAEAQPVREGGRA